jgi:hypothetical protein
MRSDRRGLKLARFGSCSRIARLAYDGQAKWIIDSERRRAQVTLGARGDPGSSAPDGGLRAKPCARSAAHRGAAGGCGAWSAKPRNGIDRQPGRSGTRISLPRSHGVITLELIAAMRPLIRDGVIVSRIGSAICGSPPSQRRHTFDGTRRRAGGESHCARERLVPGNRCGGAGTRHAARHGSARPL